MESIGQYLLGNKIEEGSQGKVVIGQETTTGKTVAIKIIDLSKSRGKAAYRLEDATRSRIANKKSKNLCNIANCFKSRGYGFVIMKKYEEDLFEFLTTQEKPLEEKEVKKIFYKICQGVRELHQSGIAHLDIKPENILLDSNRNFPICDFGSVFLLNDRSIYSKPKERKQFSCTGLRFRGTQQYSAPEVENNEFNPFQADIYSIGAILYVLLHQIFPARGESLVLSADISQNCSKLISSLMNENPLLRPTIEEVINHPWFKAPRIFDQIKSKFV